MAQGIPILKDAPYNVLTVPNYVRNLVVTTKPAQVIAAYTAPPGVEAWTVYRPSAEGVPVHPYDGWRVVTPLSEDAETTVAVTLTEHIVNDTEYVVRVFIRGKLGFQTRVGGAVAAATPVAGTPLGELPDGESCAKIRLVEGGTSVNFLVAKHNYENTGKTAVLRLDLYDKRAWSAGADTYASSSIDAWLNNDYLSQMDSRVQGLITPISIPYLPGAGTYAAHTILRKVFLPSAGEIGITASSGAEVDGVAWTCLSTSKVACYGGVATEWYTRTPAKLSSGYDRVWIITAGGAGGYRPCTNTFGSRPTFTLPSDMLFSLTPNPDGSYSPIL